MLELIENDTLLQDYASVIQNRHNSAMHTVELMKGNCVCLSDNINAHLFYGLHFLNNEWVLREWAPNADRIYLLFDNNDWCKDEKYAFQPIGNGNWELKVPKNELKHKDIFRLLIEWDGGSEQRLPAFIRRVVQCPHSKVFSAQVWNPQMPYQWKNQRPQFTAPPLIYEVHIGMSSEYRKVTSFTEFRLFVLPRIVDLGYNTIQLMAIQEHPYYGSFGYQVSNFFAVSSRFGTPEELKTLIDEAHGLGLKVIMDIVHSHSVSNQAEGLSFFDGTEYLYFHSGERGQHPLWGSRCFDYGKPQVLNFLLSNCKYWLEEFQFDGFRFDGVTSMIYYDHGLGKAFTEYSLYYDGNQDTDAITYLTLANILIHELYPQAITIAEEMSGIPGLAFPVNKGGMGFDYKMHMGVPDYWIKLIETQKDENWHIGDIYYELTNKRTQEKTISYAESHDQALVGDKTIFFRLADKEIYSAMSIFQQNIHIERAMALHKMIRLLTIATAGNGYLTFMGNEWGHPQWIDFPREGNQWSYEYARRLWSLVDDDNLKFKYLNHFDKDMIHCIAQNKILESPPNILVRDIQRQVLIFERKEFLWVFNFHPWQSYENYEFETSAGKYAIIIDTDQSKYGGSQRIDHSVHHFTQTKYEQTNIISLYIPSRTAIVLKKLD